MAKDETDETVDGAKIAAQILSRMKTANKERLVEAIQRADPEAALKIEMKLTRFEEIASLSALGLQALLREVDHKDLVMSMKTATPEVKERVLENMSQKRQDLITEDLENLPPTRMSEIEEAKWRILQKLERLKSAGVVRSTEKKDGWVS